MTIADPITDTKQKLNWGLVAMLMAFCFISHLNRISMSIAGDERIMKQYDFAPVKMGMVYSAFLLVYTIFMIPGGFFIDRFGARLALAIVGFGSAVFCMLTGAIGWLQASVVWISLILVRGAMGLVTVPLHPAAATAVGLWMPERNRNIVNGLITGAALLGIACTYKVFGSLIAAFDWPRAFLITGLATAMLASIWLMMAPRQQQRSELRSIGGWKRLLRNRNIWLLTLSYAAIGYFQYLFFYWMHYYFDDVLHLGKEASLYYAGIPPLTMALCMPIGGWLSDRSARRFIVPMAGMILGAVLLGCGVLAKTPFWIVFWFSLALGAVGAAEAAFWSSIVEAGGTFGGTAAAIMNTGGNAGGMLAPVLTPLVSKTFGWPVGIALGGLVCLAGAMCWIRIRSDHERTVN